ncbi:MAG: peptidyl-prolyl cis-trans isomerase [Candidatus Eisenbacteria bacterium]
MIWSRTRPWIPWLAAALLGVTCGREKIVIELKGEVVPARDFAREFEVIMGDSVAQSELDSALVGFAHRLLHKKLLEKEARSKTWGDATNLPVRIAVRQRAVIAAETYRAVTDTLHIDEEDLGRVFGGLDEELLLRMVSAPDSAALDSVRTFLLSAANLDEAWETLRKAAGRFTWKHARFTAIESPLVWNVASGLGTGEWSAVFANPEGYAILLREAARPRERAMDERTIESFRMKYDGALREQRFREFALRTLWDRYGAELREENLRELDSVLARHHAAVETDLEKAKEAGDSDDAVRSILTRVPSPGPETLSLPLLTLEGGPAYEIADYLRDITLDLATSRPGGGDVARLRADVTEKLVIWLAAVYAERSGLTRGNEKLERALANVEGWEYMSQFFYSEVETKVAATEEDLRSFYESHRPFFEQHPRFRVAYYKTRDEGGAQWIAASLRAGTPRDSVAAAGARRIDDLTFYPGEHWMGNLGYELDPVLGTMAVGDVSDPVAVSSGNRYVLCLLEKRTPTYEESLESGLERQVLKQKQDLRMNEIVGRLMQKYGGRVHESAAKEAARFLTRSPRRK